MLTFDLYGPGIFEKIYFLYYTKGKNLRIA